MLKEDCLYNSKYIMYCEIWSAQDSENVQIMVFWDVTLCMKIGRQSTKLQCHISKNNLNFVLFLFLQFYKNNALSRHQKEPWMCYINLRITSYAQKMYTPVNIVPEQICFLRIH